MISISPSNLNLAASACFFLLLKEVNAMEFSFHDWVGGQYFQHIAFDEE